MIALKTDQDGRVTQRHYRPETIDTTGWILVEELPARPSLQVMEKASLYVTDGMPVWQVETQPHITIPADDVPARPDEATELIITADPTAASWQ